MIPWTLGLSEAEWRARVERDEAHRLRGVSDRKLRMWVEGAERAVFSLESHPPEPGTREYVVRQYQDSLTAARARLALLEAESSRRATAQPSG